MKKLKCKCGGYPEPLYRKSKSGQRTKRGYLYKCRVWQRNSSAQNKDRSKDRLEQEGTE